MEVIDIVGTFLALLLVVLWALFVRRRWLSRAGGVIDMSLRMASDPRGGRSTHWKFGFARFDGDRLLWFRTFSLSPRPRHQLARHALRVRSRRTPHGAETVTLVNDAIVLECAYADALAEVALPEAAALGFMSWLEAAPGRVSA